MPSDDEKFRALADHYKDTFDLIRGYLRQRDRYFAATLLVLIVMLFQLAAPTSSDRVISAVIGRQIGPDTPIDRTFVGTGVWILLLASAFRYFQLVVQINRQYKYVHHLEAALSANYDGGVVFTREGRWYLDRYPAFSNWTQVIYAVVFPGVMLAVSTAKIWSDVLQVWPGWGGCCFSFYLTLNVSLYVVVLISLAIYVEIFRLGRILRVAMVTVWTLLTRWITKRKVDEAARDEEHVTGALDPSGAGAAPRSDGRTNQR